MEEVELTGPLTSEAMAAALEQGRETRRDQVAQELTEAVKRRVTRETVIRALVDSACKRVSFALDYDTPGTWNTEELQVRPQIMAYLYELASEKDFEWNLTWYPNGGFIVSLAPRDPVYVPLRQRMFGWACGT